LVIRIRYLRLKRQILEAANPEINTDRQQLISRMEAMGFRPEIVEALSKVERLITSAGTPLDFKTCMDLLRTIYEEIIEDTGKAAAAVTQRSLPPPGRDFQPWNQLLMDAGMLTSDEGALSQKLYNYLSNAGAHRLGSAPEQVRVSRNMVIELGLLVVGRVQGVKPTSP
jgi:hypothetical protein